jgi:hypothetical protein
MAEDAAARAGGEQNKKNVRGGRLILFFDNDAHKRREGQVEAIIKKWIRLPLPLLLLATNAYYPQSAPSS